MYQFSNFSGKTKNTTNSVIFLEGDGSHESLDYAEWRALGNSAEFLEYFEPEETYAFNFYQARRVEAGNYESRRNDGLEYSKNNRAWLKTKLDFEEITEVEYNNATDALINFRSQIESGDWKKAKQFLEQNEALINTNVYEEMHDFVNAYVNASYNSSFSSANAFQVANDIIGNRPNDR